MGRLFCHFLHTRTICKAFKVHKFKSVKQLSVIAITYLLFIATFSVEAQTEWKLEKSAKGINVYTRYIPETSIKEFKAEMVIKAQMKELEQAIHEVNHHPEWMAGVEYSDVLNADPKILQYNMHVPFPFTDRYVVMSSKTESDADTCRVIQEHSDYPAGKVGNSVGIEYIKGYWLFTKLDENTTSVVYQFVTDPGGSLPDWLVNSFIVKNPYTTLSNLRDRLE